MGGRTCHHTQCVHHRLPGNACAVDGPKPTADGSGCRLFSPRPYNRSPRTKLKKEAKALEDLHKEKAVA